MSDNTLTHIVFLLDRSGSMSAIKSDVEGGFNAFIDEQRKGEGTCQVTLAQFDSAYEVVYEACPVNNTPPLDLRPRGTTALLDSIGRVIADTRAAIKKLPKDKRPGTVILAIMTDGLENASKEWTRPAIKALVEERTKKGWEVLYMGANQDAVEVGTGLGISADHSITYAPSRAAAAMGTTSGLITSLRSERLVNASASMASYSAEQRSSVSE